MAFYGVDAQVRIENLNNQFKQNLRQKKLGDMGNLKAAFSQFDLDSSGKLDPREFEKALASVGLIPKVVDLKALFSWYDVDGDGHVSYNEFLNALTDKKFSFRKGDIIE